MMIKRRAEVLLGMTIMVLGAIAQPSYAGHEIIEIRDGSASIQRSGESGRDPAPIGTEIKAGDLVFPSRGSVVVVQCQGKDNKPKERRRLFGLDDVCPDGPRYSQNGRGEDDFLAFLENNFEYASQVLDGDPLLRWNPVDGATTYHLEMWDCGQAVFNCTALVWEDTVDGTDVQYGGDALTSGRNYELRVSALDGEVASTAYLTMRRLDEDQQSDLNAALAELEEVALGEEGEAIALANLYLGVAEPGTLPPDGVGLVLRAIPVLEAVATESSSPYVYRLLGDQYLEMGLLKAAQKSYETTLELTEMSEDLASRAVAYVGLANIAATKGDRIQAEIWLHKSKISYTILGFDSRREQIHQWLEELRSVNNIKN